MFVVSGAGADDQAIGAAVRAQLRPYESRFHIEYLSGLTTPDLDGRLSHPPANSMVYYTVVDQDGAGHVFHPLEYLNHITAVSNAPVYAGWTRAMDHGVVGGSVKVQKAQVDAAGHPRAASPSRRVGRQHPDRHTAI